MEKFVLVLLCLAAIAGYISADFCDEYQGGVCQDDGGYCPGGYQSGLCSGASNIRCCMPDKTSDCSLQLRGICQHISKTCNGNGYVSGLCPGSSSYRCCVPDTTTTCYMTFGGSCRDDSNPCAGGYATGLCPGASNIRCCVTDAIYTHTEAESILDSNGITVSSSGSCSNRYVSSCTSLDSIRQISITSLVAFKSASNCDVRVTGGTETGHSSGTFSHWNGWKIDIALDACVDAYIPNHFAYEGLRGDGAAMYRDNQNFLWAKEGNHWDIRFHE